MCGICGVVSLENKSVNVDIVKGMVDILEHRGPDDSGYLFFHTGARHNPQICFYLNLTDQKFRDYNQTLSTIQSNEVQKELHEHDYDLFLGFRRLAILDLSSAGHQPFSDLSRNIWLVFNGEIYNYQQIRDELKTLRHRFKSNCDTEVIVYSYVEWGIDCVSKFNGMFAFAIYNNFKKKLYLVRDRCGIKPLYWTYKNGNIIFASEIKSILVYLNWAFDIDYQSLMEYFTFQNFLHNKTLYKDIHILEPGTYLEVDLITKKFHSYKYWDFNFFSYIDFSLKKQKVIDYLYDVLQETIKRQLISDVEVGSYLSGGIDTGLVVYFASKLYKPGPLKTFTIGFDTTTASGLELNFDERKIAEYMSYLFRTEHYEMVLKARDMERCIEKLVYHLEEPRVGQSYPNFYASKLASKFVKVVLSGVGGDELFGGYTWRYLSFQNSKSIQQFINNYYSYWQRVLTNQDLLKIFDSIADESTLSYIYESFLSVFGDMLELKGKKIDYQTMLLLSFYFECKTFLHGLLVVEDKISMAHSIEERVPLLDNEVIDLAVKISPYLKVEQFSDELVDENLLVHSPKKLKGKYILRLLADKLIGSKVSRLRKQGFSAPDGSWFKGDSINFIRRVLLNKNARIYNFANKKCVEQLIEEHITGKKNRRLLIWSLLYFEYWLKIYCKL
ncbi:MAG: asparagine synthase (glutamine-hydrolyzing) [bacterium]